MTRRKVRHDVLYAFLIFMVIATIHVFTLFYKVPTNHLELQEVSEVSLSHPRLIVR